MYAMTRKPLAAMIMASIFLLWGCVKDVQQPVSEQEDLHEVVFHAGWDAETKTVLQEDGRIFWGPGDEIALFIEGHQYRLTAECSKPSPKTDFTGMVDRSGSEYFAIYPYDNAKAPAMFNIPSVQYAKNGDFSPGQIISYAHSDNENLTFYNAFAGIKFSVSHEGISKIVFENRDDHPITGDMEIQFWDRFPEYPDIIHVDGHEVSRFLTVYPKDGTYFTPGEYYYASIKPGYTELFVSYYTDNKVATTYLPVRELSRSKVAILREKDKDLTFEETDNFTYAEIEQILPQGIDKTIIREAIFHTSSDVTTGTVLPTLRYIESSMHFPVYFELQGTTAHYYTKADKYKMMRNAISFSGWKELRSVDLSMFNTSLVKDFSNMFFNCWNLRSVNLSSFDTRNAYAFNNMFESCKVLKSLDISNFSSQNLMGGPLTASRMFFRCYDLVQLDLGNFDLSSCETAMAMMWFAKFSKNCAIRCSSETRTKLCDDVSKLGLGASYITWVLPNEDIPQLEPIVDPSLYSSTDFSKDKTVKILNKATEGNGVDIVLLGDGYSDRMIADGTYDNDMELAMNAILKDEPYASFRDYINVYTVYAVSPNEIPFHSHTAFDASINEYDPVNGVISWSENEEVYRYASIAFPEKDLEDIAMILIINQAEGEGNSFTDGVAGYEAWWHEDEENLDYAAHAKSIGMINRRDRSQTETFSQIVAHEFGHVFAKLGDEYTQFSGTTIAEWEKNNMIELYNRLGFWRNLDFTSDPQLIKWKKFLEDERYSGTDIGIFQGGCGYSYGAWHPSANSIMKYNEGMFNAPSREAIYNRIHKLAFGKDWVYDYEIFVEWDRKNIEAEKTANIAPANHVPYPARVNKKPLFKMEESTTPDGKKIVTVIMD